MLEALTMLPYVEALRLVAGSASTVTVLRPPFPALGVGVLRVLRVRDGAAGLEIVLGYDNYERLS